MTDEQKLAAIKEALGKAVWEALETGGLELFKATSMFLSNRTPPPPKSDGHGRTAS